MKPYIMRQDNRPLICGIVIICSIVAALLVYGVILGQPIESRHYKAAAIIGGGIFVYLVLPFLFGKKDLFIVDADGMYCTEWDKRYTWNEITACSFNYEQKRVGSRTAFHTFLIIHLKGKGHVKANLGLYRYSTKKLVNAINTFSNRTLITIKDIRRETVSLYASMLLAMGAIMLALILVSLLKYGR